MEGYEVIIENNIKRITNIVIDSHEDWIAVLNLLKLNKYRNHVMNVITMSNNESLCYHFHITDFDNIDYLYSFEFYEDYRNILGLRWIHIWDLPLNVKILHGCSDDYSLEFKYPELYKDDKGYDLWELKELISIRDIETIIECTDEYKLPWCNAAGKQARDAKTLYVKDKDVAKSFGTLVESYNCMAYDNSKPCFQLSCNNDEVVLVIII